MAGIDNYLPNKTLQRERREMKVFAEDQEAVVAVPLVRPIVQVELALVVPLVEVRNRAVARVGPLGIIVRDTIRATTRCPPAGGLQVASNSRSLLKA